jgi:hypothetical protein
MIECSFPLSIEVFKHKLKRYLCYLHIFEYLNFELVARCTLEPVYYPGRNLFIDQFCGPVAKKSLKWTDLGNKR